MDIIDKGEPDILVNLAGINTREHADDVTLEDWDKTLDLNLSTLLFMAQSVIEVWRKNWDE